MAVPKPPHPAFQLVAVFSRHDAAIDWVRMKVVGEWGKIVLASPKFDHSETHYYEDEMGADLRKQFLMVASDSKSGFYDPARLAQSKLESNRWEMELASAANYGESRPVNIDPGYLTLSKLVLASAKDRAHRIYLDHGIYAEECLYFLGGWKSRPWTYPDYQRSDFHGFFDEARDYLKKAIQTKAVH